VSEDSVRRLVRRQSEHLSRLANEGSLNRGWVGFLEIYQVLGCFLVVRRLLQRYLFHVKWYSVFRLQGVRFQLRVREGSIT
jgi:hypothetical protein